MNTKATWQAPWVIVGCYRCNKAIRVRQREAHRQQFCTDTCARYHRREIVQRSRSEDARIRRLASESLHVIYPGMPAVMDRVQAWRPSYRAWRATR